MGAATKVDTAITIFDAVNNCLIVTNVSKATADKYAHFAVEMYTYIESRPQLQLALGGAIATFKMSRGAQGYVDAAKYAAQASEMNLTISAKAFTGKASVSAGGAISAFVDSFAGLAKSLGIDFNECAIAVTKVMLDALTIVGMADSVVGIWAAALQMLSLRADVMDMKKICFQDVQT